MSAPSLPTLESFRRRTAAFAGHSADVMAEAGGLISGYRANQLIHAVLFLGIAARSVRYLLRFPLWGDEALISINFLQRGYLELLRPLDYHQVAPIGWLWAERTVIRLLGFSEWSLRLLPFVCGIASLFLFLRIARRLFSDTAALLAMAIFSVSYPAIRYCAEVKPYGVDLFVSLALLTLAVEWWCKPDRTRWLWGLAAFVPLALSLSYPAVFVAGGISLALACKLWSRAESRGWAPWIAFNALTVATFGGLFMLSMKGQADMELGSMVREWGAAFPPHSLGPLMLWLLKSHCGPMFAEPIGGYAWGSSGTFLLCVVAAVALWRRRRFGLMLLFGGPFALNLLAAGLNRYPYGGHMRLTMHLAPIVCLLAGFGAATILESLRIASRRSVGNSTENDLRRTEKPLLFALLALASIGACSVARDCWRPGKEQQEIRKRDFADWFWGSLERDRELVCIKTDLGLSFPPSGSKSRACVPPLFLCNEQIYSPRHARGEKPNLDRVSRSRPLAFVQYWSHEVPYDQVAFDGWLSEMKTRYRYVGCQRFPLLQDNDNDREPEPSDRVEVYEFVPVGS